MFLPPLPFEFLKILISRNIFYFILLSCRLRTMQHCGELTPNYASLCGVATPPILLMLSINESWLKNYYKAKFFENI
jgi:hypothetical protein